MEAYRPPLSSPLRSPPDDLGEASATGEISSRFRDGMPLRCLHTPPKIKSLYRRVQCAIALFAAARKGIPVPVRVGNLLTPPLRKAPWRSVIFLLVAHLGGGFQTP